MSKNIHWNPRLAEHEIMGNALKRLEDVGDVMAAEVKKNTPVGTVTRPMYKTGDNKDKYWTARTAGSLDWSVRTAEKDDSDDRSIRVIVGHRKAYYAKIVEFGENIRGTGKNKHKAFFRKSINRSKRKARNILMGK